MEAESLMSVCRISTKESETVTLRALLFLAKPETICNFCPVFVACRKFSLTSSPWLKPGDSHKEAQLFVRAKVPGSSTDAARREIHTVLHDLPRLWILGGLAPKDSRAPHGIPFLYVQAVSCFFIVRALSRMFSAASSSRSWCAPHSGQSHSRTEGSLTSLFR